MIDFDAFINGDVTSKNPNTSGIARLLAAENISLIFGNFRTASADVNNRVMRLPSWLNKGGFLTDMLVGHEVGHFLFSPPDLCSEYVGGRNNAMAILDDIRVDSRIKTKFPGIRNDYVNGAIELVEKNFFKIDKDINEYGFLDRLNIWSKVGAGYGKIIFSEAEQVLVNKTSFLFSPDDVRELAKEINEFLKEKKEEEKEPEVDPETGDDEKENPEPEEHEENKPDEGPEKENPEEDESEDDQETGDEETEEPQEDESEDGESEEPETGDDETEIEGEPETGEETDAAETDGEDSDTSGTSKDEGEGETEETDGVSVEESDNDSEGYGRGSDSNNDSGDMNETVTGDETSSTMDAMEESIGEVSDSDNEEGDPTYHFNPKNTYVEKISRFEDVMRFVVDNSWVGSYGPSDSLTRRKIMSASKMLVKEFDMKKRAKEYINQHNQKSGSINVAKIPFYKMQDDIFGRKSIMESALNNHKVVIYTDTSSSMSNDRKAVKTMEQLLIFAEFCRMSNIDYEIYLFAGGGANYWKHKNKFSVGSVTVENSNGNLYKTFFSGMPKKNYTKMFNIGVRCVEQNRGVANGYTPLNSAVCHAIEMAENVTSDVKLSFIFLTDGVATDCLSTAAGMNIGRGDKVVYNGREYFSEHGEHKFRSMISTKILMDILRSNENVNSVIGIFIASAVSDDVKKSIINGNIFKIENSLTGKKDIYTETDIPSIVKMKSVLYDEFMVVFHSPGSKKEFDDIKSISDGSTVGTVGKGFMKTNDGAKTMGLLAKILIEKLA